MSYAVIFIPLIKFVIWGCRSLSINFMERKNNTVSSGQTYYFKVLPQHLKVEHGFAKNIKPGTGYRLAINRGTCIVRQDSKGWMNLVLQSRRKSWVEK